ncbi:MAG: hypothetical protein MNPFHGCM_02726 [Gemmatimonadaceae bacterium]|nr:hypothetical protein [Gemmatimonadaceae bacterium]
MTFADCTFWPEGVDFDSRTRRFYVTSVRIGTIAEVGADGSMRSIVPSDTKRIGALLGVRVDPKRNDLWVTMSGIPQRPTYVAVDSSLAALLRVRISDGVVEARWDLPPVAVRHVLGDIAVVSNGDVYVTDSAQPFLYRLRSGTGSLPRYAHPLFNSLQGVAPAPGGRGCMSPTTRTDC